MTEKIKGIVNNINLKTKGILLSRDNYPTAEWWNPIGNAGNDVSNALRGAEVEMTVVNSDKRTFSYLEILKGNVSASGSEAKEPGRDVI